MATQKYETIDIVLGGILALCFAPLILFAGAIVGIAKLFDSD